MMMYFDSYMCFDQGGCIEFHIWGFSSRPYYTVISEEAS